MQADNIPLIDDTDARRWAQEFLATITPWVAHSELDEGFMIGWFANAIETGRRHHPAQVEADRLAVEAALACTSASGDADDHSPEGSRSAIVRPD
jgi:hypothetical protein